MEEQDNNYRNLLKVDEIKYDFETTIWMSIFSVLIFYIGMLVVMNLNGSSRFVLNGTSALYGILLLIIFLIIQFIILTVHELLHGVGFRLFGHKPVYGFMFLHKFLPVGYTHARGNFSKKQFNVILLLPFFTLTILSLVLALVAFLTKFIILFYLVILTSLFHVSGCVGDFYTVYKLMGYPSTVIVENKELNDPLFIWNEQEIGLKKRNKSLLISLSKNIGALFITFILVEITLATVVTTVLFILSPIMSMIGVENLNLLLWTISTSGHLSVSTQNPFALFLLSFILSLLILWKFQDVIQGKKKDSEEQKDENQVNMPFIA